MTNVIIASTTSPFNKLMNEIEQFDRMTSRQPQITEIEFKYDPLACACASYRIWQTNQACRWNDLNQIIPGQEDIEQAEQLKQYYRERLVMQSLTRVGNTNQSEFRRKLAQLVVNDLVITNRELGLLYRLPYFYQEDLGIDAVVQETNCQIQPLLSASPVENYTLNPLRRVLKSRSSGEYYHYWFKDTTHNHPHSLVVRSDNSLKSLIDGLFVLPQIQINGLLFVKQFRGYHNNKQYYQLAEIKLVD